MAYHLQEINQAIRTDTAGFLAQCDDAYQQRVLSAADKILERMTLSPIVLLSGPSGSGKTTTALKLEEELEKRGINTHTVSLDLSLIHISLSLRRAWAVPPCGNRLYNILLYRFTRKRSTGAKSRPYP